MLYFSICYIAHFSLYRPFYVLSICFKFCLFNEFILIFICSCLFVCHSRCRCFTSCWVVYVLVWLIPSIIYIKEWTIGKDWALPAKSRTTCSAIFKEWTPNEASVKFGRIITTLFEALLLLWVSIGFPNHPFSYLNRTSLKRF